MGLVIALTVTAASVQDRDAAATAVIAQACSKVPGLEKLYTDGAYGGQVRSEIWQLSTFLLKSYDAQGMACPEHCSTSRKRPCPLKRLMSIHGLAKTLGSRAYARLDRVLAPHGNASRPKTRYLGRLDMACRGAPVT